MAEFYIGLMSGTSLDGLDVALVDFSGGGIRLADFYYEPFSEALRREIQDISQANQRVLLQNYGSLDSRLGCLFGEAILNLLKKSGIDPKRIRAIGSHGQTVFHSPAGNYGFSLQIGDPNRIAEITGITTVADFRRRDIAAGGQGAPLVPAFHQAVFGDERQARTVVNIGGIANITVLNGSDVTGFDTGPGNTLLDYWRHLHFNEPYDRNGDWAASGQARSQLLTALLDDDYFRLPPPKSTGKEYFSPVWLQDKLKLFPSFNPEDVQATLLKLSTDSITAAIKRHAPDSGLCLVCGGGAHNRQMMLQLVENLDCPVVSTVQMGIDPDHVEACAFAWLARQTLNHLPGNLTGVTGARSPMILGGVYPGKNAVSFYERQDRQPSHPRLSIAFKNYIQTLGRANRGTTSLSEAG